MERFERLDPLAYADELDRDARHRPDGERGAAASVAVHLREDETGQTHLLVELLGDVDRFLARHRVGDQKHVARPDRRAHRGQLLHQLRVDLQAAGRVNDRSRVTFLAAPGDGAGGDVYRVRLRALFVNGDVHLPAEGE